jgi:hypothetical protein
MFDPIARAVLQHRDRFKAFGLRVPPADLTGIEPMVAVGDMLPSSMRLDEYERPIGGLHRGAACCGFHDAASLESAITGIAFFSGSVVALVGGASGYWIENESSTRIIVAPVVVAIWRRRSCDVGRGAAWPPEDHADFG